MVAEQQFAKNTADADKKKYRLSDFFNAHWDNYLKNPKTEIKPEHFKAVNAIRTCRTAVLGQRVYSCESCGSVSDVYHSCKHRFCPTCSWSDTVKWAEKTYHKLLNIPHRHVVATLPHALNSLIEKNYKQINNILLRSAADTLKDWMGAKYGIIPGIMSVLHTYGERKNQHYHVHMVVSCGGINLKTGRLTTIPDEFFPFKFLAGKFRIKFETQLIELFDAGLLQHSFCDRAQLLGLLKKVNLDNWRFHIEPPMDNALQVIRYIGRYSKRACLSEHKIVSIENQTIAFRYKDYQDRDTKNQPIEKVETLHYSEFFPRLLQHVPPPGFQIIRYYGVYANSHKIPDKYTEKPEMKKESCTSYKQPHICEHCGQARLHIYTVFDKREPKNRTQQFDQNLHKNVLIDMQIRN